MVTIGLPCYNVAATVLDTVRSVFAQTLTDWELIIIDDGSTDETLALVRGIRDSRVQVVSDGVNLGRSVRLNDLHAKARGKYVARMDADDLMFPDRLAKQVAFLEENPAVDLVGGGLISMGIDCTLGGMRLAPLEVQDAHTIFRGEVLYHPTVTGRSQWFRDHQYRAEYRYCDDFAMWAESAKTLHLANLQEPMLFYRENGLFTYEKFCGRIAEMEKALDAFGPEAIGEAAVKNLQRRRRMKNAVYHGMHKLGLWRQTLRLVNRSLPGRDLDRYSVLRDEILATPIPGVEE